jgi:flagellar biosynthetic protein FliQ
VSTDSLLDLWRNALATMAAVSAPFLLTALAVGLVISIIQTATQLQEAVLAFVPKLALTLIVVALSGHWCLDKLSTFTTAAFTAHSEPRVIDPQ